MANYTVNIVSSPGNREATPEIVAFSAGDTVTFTTDSHGANLCLTTETAAVLSPSPASLCIAIAAGASVSYTFLSAAAGAYCSQVMPDTIPCAGSITCGGGVGASLLVVLPGADPGYDGGGDVPPGN